MERRKIMPVIDFASTPVEELNEQTKFITYTQSGKYGGSQSKDREIQGHGYDNLRIATHLGIKSKSQNYHKNVISAALRNTSRLAKPTGYRIAIHNNGKNGGNGWRGFSSKLFGPEVFELIKQELMRNSKISNESGLIYYKYERYEYFIVIRF